MLSLLGSLQPDPFSPKHFPTAPQSPSKPSRPSSRPAPQEVDEDGEGIASEGEEMGGVGEVNVEAAVEEERRRQEEEDERKEREKVEKKERKERKRKAREETVLNASTNENHADGVAEVADEGKKRKKKKTV